MSTRPSVSRRIAAAVLGVERAGHGHRNVTARRDLRYGRRLLAAVLGVRVETRQGSALAEAGARVDEIDEIPAEAMLESPAETRAGTMTPPRPRPHLQDETPQRTTTQVTPFPVGAVPDSPSPSSAEREETGDDIGPGEPPSLPPLGTPRRGYTAAGVRSAPQHLLSEDRPEYERLLDEALRSAPGSPNLAAIGRRLNTEQLRTMALNATPLITAAAATEYQHYVAVREEQRDPAAPMRESEDGEAAGLTRTTPGTQETAGAGTAAVLAVLAPVLAGPAAAIFLGVGYLLELLGRPSSFSGDLITTGWVFGAVTVAAILVAATGLLIRALRNTSRTETHGELSPEVRRARDAWRAALLERGIIPFLRDALGASGTASAPHRAPSPGSRMPHLGYSRPGFSGSADESEPQARSSFTSPDFTSPDFGGPEHDPE